MGNILRLLKKEPTEGFKVGDLIRCNNAQDMVITDHELIKAGYETDYAYRVNGEKGLWIEIRMVGGKEDEKED
jgi:hypothetical protein